MEISCPGAFDFLVRPTTFRTDEGSHRLRSWLFGEMCQRFTAALGEHHAQSVHIQGCLEPDRQADFRQKSPARLLSRLERDPLPASDTFGCVSRIAEMNVGVASDQWSDFLN